MDLNASPRPEEDDESFEPHLREHHVVPDHSESAVETYRREREERRQRLRRDQVDDRPTRVAQPLDHDEWPKNKKLRYDRNKLPPGWLDCPNIGQELYGIIPSKVPLGEKFNDYVLPGKRYSFKQVIHHFNVQGRKLGMVVDLTNTDRYYSTSEFRDGNRKYLKIPCQGRNSVPDNKSVNTFVFEVKQFFHSQKSTKKYVLVHCTHGHNRTGYMIIHYLMRTRPMPVTEAIQKFAEARPPGIYKPDYIEALYTFYHEPKPEWFSCPPTPEWKRSSDFDLNGEAVEDDDDGVPAASMNENLEKIVVMTNDDVLGDELPHAQEEDLRRDCYPLLKLSGGDHGIKAPSHFPGSHPVSLNRDNLQLLRQRYYYATWKADGTRYMMLITFDGCYLIDRSFRFRRVQMRFPCKTTSEGLDGFHDYTLLDGEMIIDNVNAQKQERRYLIYDLIAINHVPVIERPFYERWKMLEREVVEPRNNERRNMEANKKLYYRYDQEPFRVRRKDFWPLSTVAKLVKEFIPNLSHEADGLIFQGWDDPYVPRTHEGLLKWKYPEMNSVDFLFEVDANGRELLYLHERGKRKLMEGNRVVFRDGSDPSSYSGKIIECSWDSEEDVWVCMRIRTDKLTPNEFNTYRKVTRSIGDNITEDVLLNEITEIICLPMYADRIRSDSKVHHHSNSARRR
ncbi:hypothetical protein Nepgr_027865 [Nepenthes gracilis]|uniref:mRNA guanylyltransferase n=1 Tax=Nepenthes gracilis TaxID=150966 RepID=A0AAD3Y1L9_NEPGR|nr:hypothetical protein Nepgr_027865 [Nepenthes gracilis]